MKPLHETSREIDRQITEALKLGDTMPRAIPDTAPDTRRLISRFSVLCHNCGRRIDSGESVFYSRANRCSTHLSCGRPVI